MRIFFFERIRFSIASLATPVEQTLDSKRPPADTVELSLPKAAAAKPAALGAELEGRVEEGLLRQVFGGAPQRGQAAVGSVRALLSQPCAALAWVPAALWLCWNQLSPAEGVC